MVVGMMVPSEGLFHFIISTLVVVALVVVLLMAVTAAAYHILHPTVNLKKPHTLFRSLKCSIVFIIA